MPNYAEAEFVRLATQGFLGEVWANGMYDECGNKLPAKHLRGNQTMPFSPISGPSGTSQAEYYRSWEEGERFYAALPQLYAQWKELGKISIPTDSAKAETSESGAQHGDEP